MEKKIEELFDKYTDEFVATLKKGSMPPSLSEFTASEQGKKFRKEVLAELAPALHAEEITANDFQKIIEQFNIKMNEDEINALLKIKAEDPPMPPEAPPAGKKWIKERKEDGTAEWVLMDI